MGARPWFGVWVAVCALSGCHAPRRQLAARPLPDLDAPHAPHVPAPPKSDRTWADVDGWTPCFDWMDGSLHFDEREAFPEQRSVGHGQRIGIRTAVASGDGRLIAASSEGRQARIDFFDGDDLRWLGSMSPETMLPSAHKSGDCGIGTVAALSDDGRWLATGLRIWDLRHGAVLSLAQSASFRGARLSDRELAVYGDMLERRYPEAPAFRVDDLPKLIALSPNGRFAVASDRLGDPRTDLAAGLLIDLQDGSALALDGPVSHAVFSRKGDQVALIHDGFIQVWDVEAMQRVATIAAKPFTAYREDSGSWLVLDASHLYWFEPDRDNPMGAVLLRAHDLVRGATSELAMQTVGVRAMVPRPGTGINVVFSDGALRAFEATDAGLVERGHVAAPPREVQLTGRLRLSDDGRLAALTRGGAWNVNPYGLLPLGLALGSSLHAQRIDPTSGSPDLERFASLALPLMRPVAPVQSDASSSGTGRRRAPAFDHDAPRELLLWDEAKRSTHVRALADTGGPYRVVPDPLGTAFALMPYFSRNQRDVSTLCVQGADRTGPLMIWDRGIKPIYDERTWIPFRYALSPRAKYHVSHRCDAVIYAPVRGLRSETRVLFKPNNHWPIDAEFSPAGNYVATLERVEDRQADRLRVFALRSGEPRTWFEIAVAPSYPDSMLSLKFSPGDRQLAVSGPGIAMLFDLQKRTTRLLGPIDGTKARPPWQSLYVGDDGSAVIRDLGSQRLLLWQPGSEQPRTFDARWASFATMLDDGATLLFVDHDHIELVRLADDARVRIRVFEHEERASIVAETDEGVFAASQDMFAHRVIRRGGIMRSLVLSDEEVERRFYRPTLLEDLRAGRELNAN